MDVEAHRIALGEDMVQLSAVRESSPGRRAVDRIDLGVKRE
jgi:hypothetical protein